MGIATTIALDFSIQTLVFCYSAIQKTEKLYDLTGSITFHLCIYSLLKWDMDKRQIIAASGVLLWATRLGSFLYQRVQSHPDKRFDKIKVNPLRFFVAWMMQGVWILLTSLPVFYILDGHPQHSFNFGILEYLGLSFWSIGFLLESIADYQKSEFKKKHPKDFISTGVWKYSRYPNYFGEILLWAGNSIFCFNGLKGYQKLACLTPGLIALLIVRVSGVKLSEESQAKQYGHRADYKEYIRRTSKYFPWFPKPKID